MMLNGRNYLQAALYMKRASFSHYGEFMNFIEPYFKPLAYEHTAVLGKIEELLQKFSNPTGLIDQRKALELATADDLKLAKDVLQCSENISLIDAEFDVTNGLQVRLEWALPQISKLGLKLRDKPTVYVKDKLPAPFDESVFSGVCVDIEDAELLGIRPGDILFPQSRLRPFYSANVLMHELMHSVIMAASPGASESDPSAQGLEEGLCDLLGALYLASKMLGNDMAGNMFIYNRLAYETPQLFQQYTDYTRLAATLYKRFGLEGVVYLVNQGRPGIMKLAKKLLNLDIASIDLPSGGFDQELSDLIDNMFGSFIPSLTVSPLAKYLLRFVKPGKTVDTILAESHTDKEAGRKALEELQDNTLLAMIRDGVVVHTEYEVAVPPIAVRYKV